MTPPRKGSGKNAGASRNGNGGKPPEAPPARATRRRGATVPKADLEGQHAQAEAKFMAARSSLMELRQAREAMDGQVAEAERNFHVAAGAVTALARATGKLPPEIEAELAKAEAEPAAA